MDNMAQSLAIAESGVPGYEFFSFKHKTNRLDSKAWVTLADQHNWSQICEPEPLTFFASFQVKALRK